MKLFVYTLHAKFAEQSESGQAKSIEKQLKRRNNMIKKVRLGCISQINIKFADAIG